MKVLTLILYILLLSSCGHDAPLGYTVVRFTNENGQRLALNNGVMIYAHNQNLDKIVSIYGGSISGLNSEIVLPNGNYDFYAFGYHGVDPVFKNTFYCDSIGSNSPIELRGNDTNVSLSLHDQSSSICPSVFGSTTFRNAGVLNLIEFKFCTMDSLTTTSSSSNCSASAGVYIEIAVLKLSEINGAGPQPVFRMCKNLISGSTISGLAIPFGPQFKVSVKSFSDNNCTTPTNTANNYVLSNGIPALPLLSGTPVSAGRTMTGNTVNLYFYTGIL
ncbi:MAG: hypothetical protein ACOYL6_11960 [Bacteriovoracaceae bacterium]